MRLDHPDECSSEVLATTDPANLRTAGGRALRENRPLRRGRTACRARSRATGPFARRSGSSRSLKGCSRSLPTALSPSTPRQTFPLPLLARHGRTPGGRSQAPGKAGAPRSRSEEGRDPVLSRMKAGRGPIWMPVNALIIRALLQVPIWLIGSGSISVPTQADGGEMQIAADKS